MPGIPLLNLGAALGGLSQGWNQSRSQGLQQQLAQLQLQQAQRQQNAQGLAALALQAGLLNSPTQINPLQTMGGPGGGPQASATPAPAASAAQAPPPPAAPRPPPAFTPGGLGNPNLNQLNSPSYMTGMPTPGDATTSATTGLPEAGSTGAVPTPGNAPSPTADTTPPAVPAPAPSSQTASAGASDTADTSGGSGGGVQAVFPGGQTIDISSMFKTLDYQKLTQGLARLAPPGTSQADIYEAVADLSKLSEGDKVQQQQAGLLARTLLGGNFKLQGIGMQQSGAEQRVQEQQAGATGRTQLQQAGAGQRTQEQQAGATTRTQMQIDARQKIADASNDLRRRGQDITNANAQARLAESQQRLQIAVQQAGRQDSALQISAIRARISTIKPDAAGNYNDQQQAQLKAMNEQIAKIAGAAAQAPAQ